MKFESFLCCRRDSFITHRAFCDALAEESARAQTNPAPNPPTSKSKQNQNQNHQSELKIQADSASAPVPETVASAAEAADPVPAVSQSTGVIPSSVLASQTPGKVLSKYGKFLNFCCNFVVWSFCLN